MSGSWFNSDNVFILGINRYTTVNSLKKEVEYCYRERALKIIDHCKNKKGLVG